MKDNIMSYNIITKCLIIKHKLTSFMTNYRIIFVTALKCEADSIIKYYKLKKLLNITEYQIFSDKKQNIFLAISGIKGINASSLIGFLAGKTILTKYSVLINYGIAGSCSFAVGDFIEIHKISHKSFKQSFYPLSSKISCQKAALQTIDKEQQEYKEIMDMEAYYIFATSLKYISLENIYIFKIISDNKESDLKEVNQSFVENLIEKNLQKLIKTKEKLQALSERLYKIEFYPEEFYQRNNDNLSFFEKNKLKKELIKIKNGEFL